MNEQGESAYIKIKNYVTNTIIQTNQNLLWKQIKKAIIIIQNTDFCALSNGYLLAFADIRIGGVKDLPN